MEDTEWSVEWEL